MRRGAGSRRPYWPTNPSRYPMARGCRSPVRGRSPRHRRSSIPRTCSGTRLPPDWANLDHDQLAPIANPGGGAGVQYGFDAARLPIWFATGCSANARATAAGWWRHVLGSHGRSGPQALGLDGTTINPAPSPVFLLAGAAAATAAGDNAAAAALRARAATLASQDPTYYGDAWVVLGPALLDRAIDPCSVL